MSDEEQTAQGEEQESPNEIPNERNEEKEDEESPLEEAKRINSEMNKTLDEIKKERVKLEKLHANALIQGRGKMIPLIQKDPEVEHLAVARRKLPHEREHQPHQDGADDDIRPPPPEARARVV